MGFPALTHSPVGPLFPSLFLCVKTVCAVWSLYTNAALVFVLSRLWFRFVECFDYAHLSMGLNERYFGGLWTHTKIQRTVHTLISNKLYNSIFSLSSKMKIYVIANVTCITNQVQKVCTSERIPNCLGIIWMNGWMRRQHCEFPELWD